MDTLIDYLPLFIFGFFVLRVLFKRPKPQQPKAGRQQVTRTALSRPQDTASVRASNTSSATPFEDLVRRIEAAAAESARKADTPRQAPPARQQQRPQAPRSAPPPVRRAADAEFHAVERASGGSEFRTAEPARPDAEFHPIYDLTSEQRAYHESHRAARGPAPSAHMPSGAMPSLSMPSSDMPGAHLHDTRRAQAARRVHPIAATLMTAQGVRTAFVLKEVLGERRGARRPPR